MNPDKEKFAKALKDKFELGKLSHPDQDWESLPWEVIREELQQECLDKWWYYSKCSNVAFRTFGQMMEEETWLRLEREKDVLVVHPPAPERCESCE